MSKGNPCDELLARKFVEIIVNEKLRSKLYDCLLKEVFVIDRLRFSYDENYLTIELPAQFFDKQEFLWAGRPSDTRIEKFYKVLRSLAREFGVFYVDSNVVPSSTNLRLRIMFRLRKLTYGEKHVEDMLVRELLVCLRRIWSELENSLQIYGFNVL